ncbi:hypothetical protein MVES1_001488 [Malassezia vespertilionis]|uniref:uncharacterized protein n=1 Tax=Malassezia vespertilionis TaxID=2020962 RepID=UPI0024B20544|nr:uncharacterized protein MVES1_001488 [Malassezia vespertilionis]WFD06146.1 hypothetical protein MVES1_001488 [Malassezia vespertilionis]
MMRAEEQGNAPHENQFSPANVMQRAHMLNMRAQHMIDSLAPFAKERWAGTGVLLFLFMLRIVFAHGWYIVCYALFIYLLNLFLAFLSPKFDPAHESDLAAQDVEDGEPGLPTSSKPGGGLMSNVFHGSSGQADADTDEFRPFIRRLPEFKFWLSATQATLVSIVATFFSVFDIPVFWPVLVVYFVTLFVLTMRRQIQYVDDQRSR